MPFRTDSQGKPLGRKDRAQAQRMLDAYLAARDPRPEPGGSWSFGSLVTLFLAYASTRARPNTLAGHTKVLRRVNGTADAKGTSWRERIVRTLTATDLDRIVEAWAAADLKPSYIARMVASVQAVLNWSARPIAGRDPECLIAANPLKGYSSPHCHVPDAADRYAAAAEVQGFLRWARARARTFKGIAGRFERLAVELIRAVALTGARPGELCVAERADFEARAGRDQAGAWWGTITLDPARTKTGRKTGRKREVFLPPELVRTIRAILRLRDHHPRFVFTHRRAARSAQRGEGRREWGEPWNSNALSRKVKDLRRQAIAEGLALADSGDNRFVMYRLRHTAAANLLMAGHDPYTVGKLLGTSAAMIQKRYGSLLKGHMIGAAAALTKPPKGDARESNPPPRGPLP